MIPLPGRIVAVADVFDALTHRRPYKEPWPVDAAVREVIAEAGTRFDPSVVEAFARLEHSKLVHPKLFGLRTHGTATRRTVPGASSDAAAA